MLEEEPRAEMKSRLRLELFSVHLTNCFQYFIELLFICCFWCTAL